MRLTLLTTIHSDAAGLEICEHILPPDRFVVGLERQYNVGDQRRQDIAARGRIWNDAGDEDSRVFPAGLHADEPRIEVSATGVWHAIIPILQRREQHLLRLMQGADGVHRCDLLVR